MKITIVTTCTDRKRSAAVLGPRARALSRGTQQELGAHWRHAVASSRDVLPAHAIYCGRSFREAETAATTAQGELLVISAGLGLIDASAKIPRYDLTLTRGSDDDISTRCTEEFDPTLWWSQVNGDLAYPIARRLRQDNDRIFVICLSRAYAKMVLQDLLSLGLRERSRLRLIGPSLGKYIAGELKPYVLPYDRRIDAPNSPYAGTLSDFAGRAARHFTTEIFPHFPNNDSLAHAKAVETALSFWQAIPRPPRTSMTDDGIINAITRSLPSIGPNSARMLRHLRDGLAISCEQRRFSSLFKLAIERVSK